MYHQQLVPGQRGRHRHDIGYVALVLSGTYEEVGDTGRWLGGAGDLVYHNAYEAHRNLISSECSIVNIEVPSHLPLPPVFRVREPERLLAAASSNHAIIGSHLIPTETKRPVVMDWPDLLARDLRNQPQSLGKWAEQHSLKPETISRGFRKAYGITPAKYRREAQARKALRMIAKADGTIADIAARAGFSDQAHMSRTLVELTGYPPRRLQQAKSNSFNTVLLSAG